MHIAVVVEHVWDPASVELDPLTGALDASRAVYVLALASESALETALRLRDQRPETAVSVYGVGPRRVVEMLRTCLAVGAQHVTHVEIAPTENAGPATEASALAAVLADQQPDLLLLGNRSATQGPAALGPMLAELLSLPHVTAVEALELNQPGAGVRVRRRLERGFREELAVALPAVLCLEPGIARLRAASLPALLAARTAEIPVVHPAFSRMPPEPRLVATHAPRPRPHRLPAPDPSASVEERLKTVLGSGQPSPANALVTGTPDEVVERIIALLRERGYI